MSEDKKEEDYLYFLNSLYCKGKWTKNAEGKSVRLQNDFLQINVKHCDTNETELLFIEEPKIDFYVVKTSNGWVVNSLSNSDLEKIHGIYNYES